MEEETPETNVINWSFASPYYCFEILLNLVVIQKKSCFDILSAFCNIDIITIVAEIYKTTPLFYF